MPTHIHYNRTSMGNQDLKFKFLRSHWSQMLLPGMNIMRWLLLLFAGVTITALGLAFMIRELYITNRFPELVYIMALRFLPDWVRGLLLLTLGLGASAIAFWYLNRAMVLALLPGSSTPNNLEMITTILLRQHRRQGPKIVAIGGGTGMPQLLRGLRQYTDNITAIVTVADDGGSSGRLRRQMGVLPPGDFRNNISALSEAEDLMTRLFQYRFPDYVPSGEVTDEDIESPETGGLAGHSFGNLFIATMAAVTGSFETGIAESSRVLAVRGRVLPSTLEHIVLCAEICRNNEQGEEEWLVVEGESRIPETGGRIMRAFINPENARAYPATIQAILQADLIVAGPGSFYTSVLPNLLVPSIQAAIRASAAPRVFICNAATQAGETDGYSVTDHIYHLRKHVGSAFNAVLANDNHSVPLRGEWVTLPEAGTAVDYTLYTADLIDRQRPWRHDANKLAARLMEIYAELQPQSPSLPKSGFPLLSSLRNSSGFRRIASRFGGRA
jgi:uncharacterized cofD-like protein